jgi:hypothetical protein
MQKNIGLKDTVIFNSHLWSGVVCLESELFALQEKFLNLFHPTSNVTLKLGNGVFRFKIFPKSNSIFIWIWKKIWTIPIQRLICFDLRRHVIYKQSINSVLFQNFDF